MIPVVVFEYIASTKTTVKCKISLPEREISGGLREIPEEIAWRTGLQRKGRSSEEGQDFRGRSTHDVETT